MTWKPSATAGGVRSAKEEHCALPPGLRNDNRELSVLKHMLNKAVEWAMLEVSPFKRGKSLMFKENNERLRFLTEEEIEPLLAACLPHLRPIVETALLTGMRAGELLSLRWDQIVNGMIYLKDTKCNKPRQIPISERLELRQKRYGTTEWRRKRPL